MYGYQEESEQDKIVEDRKAKVIMPAELREKIHGWIKACPTECGGLGTVQLTKNGDFMIDNVFIFRQMGSGGYFRLCNKARSMFETGLIRGTDPMLDTITAEAGENDEETAENLRKAKAEAGRAIYGRMRFHWHSHVNMSTFWSPTDVAAADDMLTMYNWAVMMVANKRGEAKFKFVNKEPKIILDNLPFKKLDRSWSALHAQCKKEVDELVMPIGQYTYDEELDEVVEAPKNVINRIHPKRSRWPGNSRAAVIPYLSGADDDNEVIIDTVDDDGSGLEDEAGAMGAVLCLACHRMQQAGRVYCENCGASVLEPDTAVPAEMITD